jgi:hypothetical protein
MSITACPFCGEHMEAPLRFCVACGRATTADDLKRVSLRLQGKRSDGGRSEISKRDFTFHRQLRSLMYSMSAMLALLIGYYFVMKYVLHEHMPGHFDVTIEQVIAGLGGGSAPSVQSTHSGNGDVTATQAAGSEHQ